MQVTPSKMVCPMCVAAVVSQAAVPVVTAVGGAFAAKAVLKTKPAAARGSLGAKKVHASAPQLATIEHREAQPKLWPVPARKQGPQRR